ncbi:MAG: helix-turn-helix domain-containing protein [Enterococcus lacertideformus]|uniref:Helix-turn-helix domain-containing protein n=1 Tax=Enterococcus lacertideformus TaxID=2771493 RepID=A0A931B0X0_9ENTE|nr:helix-turn-helix domain-containing protein [Enterococcus lacertideformus]
MLLLSYYSNFLLFNDDYNNVYKFTTAAFNSSKNRDYKGRPKLYSVDQKILNVALFIKASFRILRKRVAISKIAKENNITRQTIYRN